jgi:hypothetical protein
VKGSGAAVDFFHLDLCGTLEGSYELIRKVLPLVLASQGRCLAVTVADQRRNISHENFKPVFIEGKRQFGKLAAEGLLRTLKVESKELATYLEGEVLHEGIARREYGFFVHLAKVLGNTRIEQMVRYMYHSEVGDRNTSFRMRTYMFRLGQGALSPEEWVRTPIQLVSETGIIATTQASHTEEKESTMTTTFNPKTYPALAGMLQHASAEVRADVDRLVEDLGSSHTVAFAEDLILLLAKHGFDSNSKKHIVQENDAGVATTVTFPGETWGTTSKEVAVKLFLLEKDAEGADALTAACPVAAKYLGINRMKNRRRTLGSHLARTKGEKFRPIFLKSVLESIPKELHDPILNALAGYYTTLGNETTVKALIQEAIGAGYNVS